MTGYRVEIARPALKSLSAIPRREQQRVRAAIDLLVDNPRPPGCVAVAGEAHAYRVRGGDYRIVYELFDDRLVIQVVRIGKVKVSATVSPERLEQAKQLTGCDNVSEVIDRGLQALIVREAERIHVDGYSRAPQGADAIPRPEPGVWAEVPWDDE